MLLLTVVLFCGACRPQLRHWQISYNDVDSTSDVVPFVAVELLEGQRPEFSDVHAAVIRVPHGVRYAAYDQPNFRGHELILDSSWSFERGPWPMIRSFRILKGPDSFPADGN